MATTTQPVPRSKHPAKTVLGVSRVNIFTVTFVDKNQHESTRLMFVDERGNMFFLHQDGFDESLRQPAEWLKQGALDLLVGPKPKEEALPDNTIKDLPLSM